MPKRQIPFLLSVLRSDIQNCCKLELQWPDNMTIVNKLPYIDSYYLASMVIFFNVLKRWFWNNFLAKSCFKTILNHGSLINDKHETELNNRMEWNWDHFHRFRHCPLSYILLLKNWLSWGRYRILRGRYKKSRMIARCIFRVSNCFCERFS